MATPVLERRHQKMYTHQYQVGGWGIQNNLNDDDVDEDIFLFLFGH